MLTNHAFNALLKTLEEPPKHVKFILATTDPQKLPQTILSRTLRFEFRRIRLNTLKDFLIKKHFRKGPRLVPGITFLLIWIAMVAPWENYLTNNRRKV